MSPRRGPCARARDEYQTAFSSVTLTANLRFRLPLVIIPGAGARSRGGLWRIISEGILISHSFRLI